MTSSIRRTVAAAAVAAFALTSAACSDDTNGKASPSSSSSSDKSSSDESTSDESTSESDSATGSEKASDGSFTFALPAGYEDGLDKISLPGAVAAVFDPASDSDFPTHVVVTKTSASATLDEMLKEVMSQVESKFGTTATEDDPGVGSIDGEPYKAFTTADYTDQGKTIASALILTKHGDSFYSFTVNALPDKKSDAGQALIDFVESVKWAS